MIFASLAIGYSIGIVPNVDGDAQENSNTMMKSSVLSKYPATPKKT